MEVSQEDPPLVTIIIPVFNGERTVGAAISSALSQTYPRVEVVVVDDGSSDASGAIARAYGALITLVQQPNRGPSEARNSGFRVSKGDFFSLCDADDILLADHVQRQFDAWRLAGPRHWVCSNAIKVSPQGVPLRRTMLAGSFVKEGAQVETILRRNFVSIFSFFPLALLHEVGAYDPDLRRCEDWHLWVRAMLQGWRVVRQDTPTALYFMSLDSLSADRDAMARAETEMFTRVVHAERSLLTGGQLRAVQDRLRHGSPEHWRLQGARALRQGDFTQAAANYRWSSQLPGGARRHRALALGLRLAPRVLQSLARSRQPDSSRRNLD